MAIAFVGAGTGAERLTTGSFTVSKTCTAGNLVVFDMRVLGTTGDWGGWGTIVNAENLAGTDNAVDFLMGSVNRQIAVARCLSNGTVSGNLAVGASGEDIAGRLYEFSGVTLATTLATVLENAAGTNTEAAGTGTLISDADVTTNGVDRLALNLVALDSAQATVSFTGETGGDWTEPGSEYVGTTITLQLQTAAIASAGTIDGGTYSVGSSTAWSSIGTALIPAAVTVDTPRFAAAPHRW